MDSFELVKYDRIFNDRGGLLIDENIIESLREDINLCFPKETEETHEYATRLMRKLNKDLKPVSYNNSNSNSCSMECSANTNNSSNISSNTRVNKKQCLRAGNVGNSNADPILFGVEYKKTNSNSRTVCKWFLYVLYKQGQKNVDGVVAHCLVKFTRNKCEIHEVCVRSRQQIKGACTTLISKVIDSLFQEDITHVNIYCENKNGAACMCYVNAFTMKLDNPETVKLEIKNWFATQQLGNMLLQKKLRIVRGENTTTFSLLKNSINGGNRRKTDSNQKSKSTNEKKPKSTGKLN
jgi:Acetyltransferase (GNAT) family